MSPWNLVSTWKYGGGFDNSTQQTKRYLSSSSSSSKHKNDNFTTTTNNATTNDDIIVLYQRDESRNIIPRSLLLFTSMNTLYWVWYVLDFVPALSAAADLVVDPSWGHAGLSIGIVSQSIVTLYTNSLVSSLSLDKTTNPPTWNVCKHTIPFFTISKKPIIYKIGQLTMDPTSNDTKRIVSYGLERFQGHFPISVVGRYFPLLVEVRSSNEIKANPQLLLELLLDPTTTRRSNESKQQKSRRKKHPKNNNINNTSNTQPQPQPQQQKQRKPSSKRRRK